jgi:hypothetical protein
MLDDEDGRDWTISRQMSLNIPTQILFVPALHSVHVPSLYQFTPVIYYVAELWVCQTEY